MITVKEMKSDELETLLYQDNDIIVIDVRENEEIINGMIEGAKHIPLASIPSSIINLDKEKHYVIVCRSGARSLEAALYLQQNGYKVSNLVGGMIDWKGEVII